MAQTQSKEFKGSNGALLLDIIVAGIFGAIGMLFAGLIGLAGGFLLVLAIMLSMSVRIVPEWGKLTVFRLGNYVGTAGPGLVAIYPIIYTTPNFIDLRVRSTPFKAEETLTKDNVPVDVDAILFWEVEDPQDAILNVQDYESSVSLAAQTCLRDVIGKNSLSDCLAGRATIGAEIDVLIEERIEKWGIKATSVEIRDVQIPEELQKAMASVATADREKQARVTLAESESLAADKMVEASKKYQADPVAMQLRALNMMYEVSMNGKNQIIFIPTENRGFAMPTPLGIMGIKEILKPSVPEAKPVEGKGKKAG